MNPSERGGSRKRDVEGEGGEQPTLQRGGVKSRQKKEIVTGGGNKKVV